MQYRFSRQAERDIENIGDFIARDNPAGAVTFIAELRQRCREIVDWPRAALLARNHRAGLLVD